MFKTSVIGNVLHVGRKASDIIAREGTVSLAPRFVSSEHQGDRKDFWLRFSLDMARDGGAGGRGVRWRVAWS